MGELIVALLHVSKMFHLYETWQQQCCVQDEAEQFPGPPCAQPQVGVQSYCQPRHQKCLLQRLLEHHISHFLNYIIRAQG